MTNGSAWKYTGPEWCRLEVTGVDSPKCEVSKRAALVGELKTELTDLLAENARLRRRIEDVERKLAAATRKKGPWER